MEENTDIEQARSLVIETSRLMVAYRDNSEKLVNDVRNELDKFLIEQRRMLVQMIREEVTKEVSQAVYAYVKDMEKARNQMADQVREFNGYLRKVQEENNKISSRSVWVTSLTLATLVIGGIALIWFYSGVIQSKKIDADMVTRINQADIVRCGNDLCARTSKAGENGYRVIKKR
ncbi:TPA: lytic enzyme [Neisseria subflava]|jgi:hypothetical protein|uniref:lytic enzyme n=1 Tax=Neisseria TaxID=482 RepID=UPI00280A88D8|nr:lytic enzyme [Neisseria subflava]